MRVLVVIDDLRRAGAQRVILQEIQALHPHAVRFDIAVLASAPQPDFVPELSAAGVRVYRIPGSGLLDARRVWHLSRLIDCLEPDLVHTHLSYANIFGALVAGTGRRPLVASLHNPDTNQLCFATAKRNLEGFLLRRYARFVVVVSNAARNTTARNFGLPIEQTVVVPNGIGACALPPGFDRQRKRCELGIHIEEQIVCCVGRLDPSKGQRFLLQAVAELPPGVHVVLVGGGPEDASLRDHAARLGLANRVMFLGVRQDVMDLVAASDLFVLPSLNEGLSQALLEACMLRVPVVVENEQTGWCVPPGDDTSLASAMREALVDRPLARAYADAAAARVREQFSLEAHLVHLQAMYSTLVQ
jgi:glycosyltransferase involved in cell wall biosynthesis